MQEKFDFIEDLKQIITAQFKILDISIPKNKDFNILLLDYLTISRKIIRTNKRVVLINPEFQANLNKHPKKKVIKHIISLLDLGLNVNLFQSEKVFQTGYHDQLMYNWNIYHLHLSLEKHKKNSFRQRTNMLLFVYITNDKAIILGTDKHTNEVFGDVKWLEILHDYFPEELEHLKPVDIVDTTHTYNSKERQQLWNHGVSSGFVKVRNTIYLSPGMGIMTSGHSIDTARNRGNILRWIYESSKQFDNYSEIIVQNFGHNVNPKLILGDNGFEIVDKKTNTHYLGYRQTFNIPDD